MKRDILNNSILLIEDNPVDIDLTLRAFKYKKMTHPIEIARDGEEALEWVNKWRKGSPRPVVILLDLNLPKVHGLEVLREIKSNESLKTIPVVVLTTSSDDMDVKTAYSLGANSYIIKPVDFEKFIEVAGQIKLYWTVLNKPSSST